jgi:hypothetical protein
VYTLIRKRRKVYDGNHTDGKNKMASYSKPNGRRF